MSTYKTPGVYVDEVPPFPPQIVDVESIPAFVGHTVKAVNAAPDDLRLEPTLVRSMADVVELFGDSGARDAVVHLSDAAGVPVVERVDPPAIYHPLYFALQLYFDNGGRQCHVVSVGSRSETSPSVPSIAALMEGVAAVGSQSETTLLVVPEARSLAPEHYGALTTAILTQCATRRDRFAILDLIDGANPDVSLEQARACFAEGPGLAYGAVYYPDLGTTLRFPYVEAASADGTVTSNALVRVNGTEAVDVVALRAGMPDHYAVAVAALRELPVVVPPSAAVAGAVVRSDTERGVWKAPANLALESVFAPAVMLTDRESERFAVDPISGRSVNTIRAFPGSRATLIWGARTLAGNDPEWKYVSVRRLLMMLEQSIDKGTRWVVFEPNNAATWVKVRATIENYLSRKWQEGAFVGATTREAFFVRCGLGSTMTAQDVAEGRLVVEIGVAPVRPAEFIGIRVVHRTALS